MKAFTLEIPPEVRDSDPGLSPRSREVRLQFGLCHEAPSVLQPLRWRIEFPSLALITGPSGCGKSTLLRRIAREIAARHSACGGAGTAVLSRISLPRRRAAADCFRVPPDEAIACLARAGLAEPRLWLRAPAMLSEGEQFRFRLARLMASRAGVLIVDEFAALLDRATARAVAYQFGRFVRSSGRAAMVATSHDDLAGDLRPTRHVRMGT